MTQTISQKIQTALSFARLSPSSHNTQPWTVKLQDSSVVIGYNPKRQLMVGDPDRRELFVSLGAFIETLFCAAEDCGLQTAYNFLGDDASGVARLSFSENDITKEKWLNAIKERRTDRRAYDKQALENGAIDELTSTCFGDASFKMFAKPEDVDFFAKQTSDATFKVMSDPAFRAELAVWVRNNWTKQPDGMPGYTQGMPGPISLLAKLIIPKAKGIAKQQASKDGGRVATSAAIGLVVAATNSPASWVDAGRVYQAVCLKATSRDIKTAGVTAALVVSETTEAIKKQFNITGTPVALIRFGYAKDTVKTTPRFSAEQLLSQV